MTNDLPILKLLAFEESNKKVLFIFNFREPSVNRKDLQALTLVGTPMDNWEPDPLAVLDPDNWLYMMTMSLQNYNEKKIDNFLKQIWFQKLFFFLLCFDIFFV